MSFPWFIALYGIAVIAIAFGIITTRPLFRRAGWTVGLLVLFARISTVHGIATALVTFAVLLVLVGAVFYGVRGIREGLRLSNRSKEYDAQIGATSTPTAPLSVPQLQDLMRQHEDEDGKVRGTNYLVQSQNADVEKGPDDRL